MIKTVIVFSAALCLMLGACNSSSNKMEQTNTVDSAAAHNMSASQTFNLDTTKLKSGETFYQCEMNPEVLSDKAGNCPKCGMELSKMIKS